MNVWEAANGTSSNKIEMFYTGFAWRNSALSKLVKTLCESLPQYGVSVHGVLETV